MSWIQATFTLINIQLGTGPLILPSPFMQAGALLSTIWLVIIGWISYTTAEFLIESLARLNYYSSSSEDKGSLLSEEPTTDNNDEQDLELVKVQQLEIKRPIEIGEMAQIVSGRSGEVFATVVLGLYMMGVIISKCIMTGNTLSKVFEHISVLNAMEFWLGLFFLVGAVFSFGNIQQTKPLQIIIIIIRFLSIASMIVGALYLVFRDGSKGIVPADHSAVDFNYFPELFSNTIFGLLCHHSIPSIMSPVKPSGVVRRSMFSGFAFSIVSVIVIPITGILAFGGDLADAKKGDLKYYNMDFETALPAVYYFVSFYIFLNVAAIPVLTIVLRNNILKLIAPRINANQFSMLLSIVLVVSIFARHAIEYVLMFTGGVCGVFLLIIIPAFLVIRSREKTHHIKVEFSHQSYIRWKLLPYLFIVLGFGSLLFNLVETVIKLTRK